MKHLVAFGQVKWNYPLSRLTSFGIGGQAKAVVWVNEEVCLRKLLSYLRESNYPYYFLGQGTNVLVGDHGYPGIIIKLGPGFSRFGVLFKGRDKVYFKVGAGIKLSRLLKISLRYGWGGLEYLVGIPGTLGGAIAGNAGAFGHSIEENITEIKVMTKEGEIKWYHKDMLRFDYRTANLPPGALILEAHLGLVPSNKREIMAKMYLYFQKKKLSQPLNMPSAGCVFKNPKGAFAGKLIEEVGLKGYQIGNAKISEKHANFIVNLGGARASDVLALMDLAQDRVLKEMGIFLEPEIKILQ